jgi:glycosyltransferase involved in cell wall biosynthesis
VKLAICHSFLDTRGGTQKVILKIAKHFDAKIYCSIYEPENTFPEFKELEVEVLKTSLRPLLGIFSKRVMSGIKSGLEFYSLKLDDYDIVNAHGTPSEWVRNRNSPVVWYSHSPNREAFDLYEFRMRQRNSFQKALFWSLIQPFKIIENSLVPKIEYIFANSLNTQSRLKRYLKVNSEVLNPGIEYGQFYCQDYKNYFLYPSRITPEKRFEFAIEAFRKFKSKAKKSWRLIIAGALDENREDHVKYYEKISKMCRDDVKIKLNVSDREFNSLYANCYSVLYSPIDEDFGIVPLEALSSYKPCIAINEGGPKEILIDGETGFLVNSSKEMASKMSYLAERPEVVEEMGKNGRKYVERNFSWGRFLKRFKEVCEKTAKSSSLSSD